MKEIIISKSRIKIPNNCPKCNHKNIFTVKKINAFCQKCRNEYVISTIVNPIESQSWNIERALEKENEIIIKTEIKKYYTEDEKEYWENILKRIRENKELQKCWDVGEIKDNKDISKTKKCKECGYCNNCVTCLECGKHYSLDKKRCPECNSVKRKKTSIPKFEKRGTTSICPYCKSEDIYHSYFYEGDKCPYCKTTNIEEGKEIQIKQMIIKRKKKYEI